MQLMRYERVRNKSQVVAYAAARRFLHQMMSS